MAVTVQFPNSKRRKHIKDLSQERDAHIPYKIFYIHKTKTAIVPRRGVSHNIVAFKFSYGLTNGEHIKREWGGVHC